MGDAIRQGRWTAEIEGDFVVFIIGARPNKWRLVRSVRDLGGNAMTVDPAACRLPEGWADLLHRGPVMTTIPGHYVILAGINGDGTPEGTQVQIFDPSAGEHWMQYTDFERLYEADPASITMQY